MKTIKNMNSYKIKVLLVIFLLMSASLSAREMLNVSSSTGKGNQPINLAGCVASSAKADLDINNVRCTILAGGDMWWDLVADPRYEVPKNSKKYSIFCGSLWIGGIDAGKNLRVAAQTYRQGKAIDFWTGPLDTATASITKETCDLYDRHFVIDRTDVESFVNAKGAGGIPNAIAEWPGNGVKGDLSTTHDRYLAPFKDVNGDGFYDPSSGDYPKFNLGKPDKAKGYLLGDRVLWWVFNDAGSAHTSSKSTPIGMEIQAQAFAFQNKPGDPVSNMTFYQYKIINRSSTRLDSCYFGQFVDPDLGKYDDDFVGCDVKRGLGYCYNGDAEDEGAKGYGFTPPAVGVDFFEGPLADSIDWPKYTKSNHLIPMVKFMYFNNDGTVQGNPNVGKDFYNYLRGIWIDNTPVTYGGNGKGQKTGATTEKCNFMFPGDTDPAFPTGWTESTAENQFGDRRFVQSAGPFTLKPGAVNYITTGVVWARANSGDQRASVELLRIVDDKAQKLFDNNFEKLKGPDAPDVTIREMDDHVIIYLSNSTSSNNINEQYIERDKELDTKTNPNLKDTMYKFQGYMILQLKDPSYAGSYLNSETNKIDPDKAKVVAQCDIEDNVGQIVNFTGATFDTVSTFTGAEMVYKGDGDNDYFNKGLRHSFKITKDLFSLTDGHFVKNKKYYYSAVAYAYNATETLDPRKYNYGQVWTPFITGTRNSRVYVAVPHTTGPENGGQILKAGYGTGVKLTRETGRGNGGVTLDMNISDELFKAPYKIDRPVYAYGHGPVNVKVFDPVKLGKFDYKVSLTDTTPTAKWILTNTTTGESETSATGISVTNEQIIEKWGLSLQINQVKAPTEDKDRNKNGVLVSPNPVFADSINTWLTFIKDEDGVRNLERALDGGATVDWIRVGRSNDPKDYVGIDNDQNFEKIVNGTWTPFALTASDVLPNYLPASSEYPLSQGDRLNMLKNLPSILLVITPDKDKWTRSVVVQTNGTDPKTKLFKKNNPSVGKDGKPDNTGTGKGWFPGYAVNMESGERLNIIFGEDSTYTKKYKNGNDSVSFGNDMIWNPTNEAFDKYGNVALGGKHFIYVINHSGNRKIDPPAYDEGNKIDSLLSINDGSGSTLRAVYKDAAWVSMPLLINSSYSFTGNNNIPPSEVKFRLLVSSSYKKGKYAGDADRTAPSYSFSTRELSPEFNNAAVAKNALDLINVVPNPYYATNDYETTQFDKRVKITNLPRKCTVSIFSVNGSLIRSFNVDAGTYSADNTTGDYTLGTDINTKVKTSYDNSLDWDLNNFSGIPIASGLYIIHVKADGVGEKVIKWFGVLRPLDLGNY